MSFDLYFAGTQNEDCESFLLSSNSCRLQSQVNDRKNKFNVTNKKYFEGGLIYVLCIEKNGNSRSTPVEIILRQ